MGLAKLKLGTQVHEPLLSLMSLRRAMDEGLFERPWAIGGISGKRQAW